MRARLNYRSLFTFLTCFVFLLMAFSGAILYITPYGRIAYWTNWHLLGLDKAQWEAVHTVLSILFLIAACFHLYYNWRLFIHYLRNMFKSRRKL
ncbi:MAG: DUF4405 domain-containing protein [Candidatus Desulfofervidaceae bacterium]|nr:DUF4405 domain-containing protein [Candidatus Desulfofervidaceae bacterium]